MCFVEPEYNCVTVLVLIQKPMFLVCMEEYLH